MKFPKYNVSDLISMTEEDIERSLRANHVPNKLLGAYKNQARKAQLAGRRGEISGSIEIRPYNILLISGSHKERLVSYL